MSRQNLRKLALRYASTFPTAIHDGNPSIWHLGDVLYWLSGQGYAVDASLLEISVAARQVNIALQARRPSAERSHEREALMA